MHHAVAAKLREDARLVDRARARVRDWRASRSVHEDYVRAWESLLALPLDTLCAELTDPGERARALRQVSPFAGVLDPHERWAIYKKIS